MNEQDATQQQQRVTVAEAATVLGLSADSVRRLIRDGTLKGDRVQRGRGWSYLVTLPPIPPDATREPATAPRLPLTVADAALIPASAVAPIITPLVAQLVDQAETIGRLRAEAGFRRAPRRQVARRSDRRARAVAKGAE